MALGMHKNCVPVFLPGGQLKDKHTGKELLYCFCALFSPCCHMRTLLVVQKQIRFPVIPCYQAEKKKLFFCYSCTSKILISQQNNIKNVPSAYQQRMQCSSCPVTAAIYTQLITFLTARDMAEALTDLGSYCIHS